MSTKVIIILRKRLIRARTRKSRVIKGLDLEGTSEILIQTSPFTNEETKQRELAQGH